MAFFQVPQTLLSHLAQVNVVATPTEADGVPDFTGDSSGRTDNSCWAAKHQ